MRLPFGRGEKSRLEPLIRGDSKKSGRAVRLAVRQVDVSAVRAQWENDRKDSCWGEAVLGLKRVPGVTHLTVGLC